VPAVFAHQLDEDTANQLFLLDPAVPLCDPPKGLGMGRPNRDQQPSPDLKLLHKGWWNARGTSRHYNRLKGRSLRPPHASIADSGRDVVVFEATQGLLRALSQGGNSLNRINPSSQLGQNGGLVPRPGTDLKHPFSPLQCKGSSHDSDHVRLRDGLPLPDGQGGVFVGPPAQRWVNKKVPRDLAHRLEDSAIVDPPPLELVSDHTLPGCGMFTTRCSPSVPPPTSPPFLDVEERRAPRYKRSRHPRRASQSLRTWVAA